MRRPGADNPAMKDTTGFALIPELYCVKYSAAFSSATPPISPIKIMPFVSYEYVLA
jgi:hypothetical protein